MAKKKQNQKPKITKTQMKSTFKINVLQECKVALLPLTLTSKYLLKKKNELELDYEQMLFL